MASDAEDPVAVSSVADDSLLGIGDVAGDGWLEEEETRTEGSSVLWGEFQGTQQNDGEEEGDCFTRGLHASHSDGKNL